MSSSPKNIALAFEAIDQPTMEALVETFPDRISTIVINNPEELTDTAKLDRLQALRDRGLDVLFDVQIAGGYEATIRRVDFYRRRLHPEIITTAMGISMEGLRAITMHLHKAKSGMRVYATGVLPELSRDALASATNNKTMDPREYTTVRAGIAKLARAHGVYGSAHEATDRDWVEDRLEYFATGISPDGLAYADKRPENVTKLTTAFAIGATTGLIGSSIYEHRFRVNKPDQVEERVELIGKMIDGTFIETYCEVE